MSASLTPGEEAQLMQTIEMFEVITQSQPQDYQSLEILKEAYFKLGREADVMGTSKRIAEAYVQLGQLSSAILEYESILQRYPNDPDVQKALAEIENRATNFAPAPEPEPVAKAAATGTAKSAQKSQAAVDDGRDGMEKVFVGGKYLSAGDFGLYWSTPTAGDPGRVVEPFIQLLADKGLLPLETSVKLLVDKTRLGYLPLDRYDLDVEVARMVPREVCQRWCVLPFDRMSKAVFVATANPFNKQAALELENALQRRIIWYLTPPMDLVKSLGKIFR